MPVSPLKPASADPRQNELQQLQREYHNMEFNRRAYEDQSHAVLREQQSTIDKLRRDNDVLKSDIAVILRGNNKPISAEMHEAMQQLSEQGDKYFLAIEAERQNNTILEEQIQIMRNKIYQQRKSMGGVNAPRENYLMIQKQIRILENRLDKSLVKFNEAISHNKALRDQIDDLRRERVVFENIYRKIERDLQEKKRQMAEIIELSNQAYEQRDNFQMEVAAIEQANRKEREEFDEQMAALARMLDTELTLPAMGSTNQNALTMNAKGSRSLPRLYMTAELAASRGALSRSPSRLSPTRLSRSAGGMGSLSPDSKSISQGGEIDYKERVQNFEEAFNKIKAATGISDVDTLVKTFIKNEEHNFSLFNYVNEQNNEIEKLEEQIAQLKDEERKFAEESGQDVNQHKEILKDLETKLNSTNSMAEKYELRCQDLSRILESLKRGMQSICNRLEWEDEENNQPPAISDANMVIYLGILEKKANELLQRYKHVQTFMLAPTGQATTGLTGSIPPDLNATGYSLVTLLGSGPKVPMGTDYLHVVPPKADDYRSDEDEDGDGMGYDDDNRPLTRDELKSRTLNRLQRRLQGLGAGGPSSNSPGGPVEMGDSAKGITARKKIKK
jgi:chromosome segregation ATPase